MNVGNLPQETGQKNKFSKLTFLLARFLFENFLPPKFQLPRDFASYTPHSQSMMIGFISRNSERVRRETCVQFLTRFHSKILQISTMVSPKIRFISTRVNATTFSCNGFGFKMNAEARVDQNVVCYLAIHSSSFAIRNASKRNQRFFFMKLWTTIIS